MEGIEQENPSRDGETFDGRHIVFSPVACLWGGYNLLASGNGNISGDRALCLYGMADTLLFGVCIRFCLDSDYAL